MEIFLLLVLLNKLKKNALQNFCKELSHGKKPQIISIYTLLNHLVCILTLKLKLELMEVYLEIINLEEKLINQHAEMLDGRILVLTITVEKKVRLVLLPLLLVIKLKLFKYLLLHQLDGLEINFFHILLGKLQCNKLRELP